MSRRFAHPLPLRIDRLRSARLRERDPVGAPEGDTQSGTRSGAR